VDTGALVLVTRAPSDIDSFKNLSEQIAALELQYPCFISSKTSQDLGKPRLHLLVRC
jgi:hypothetical protein